jgi:hypothetical protein
MAPEDEHVRGIERCVAQPLIRIIETHGLHGKAGLFLQMRGDGLAEELLSISLLLLRLLLVPDENSDGFNGKDRANESTKEKGDEFHGWKRM